MDELTRRSPLAAMAEEMASRSMPQLALREIPFLPQINLRGNGNDEAFTGGVENAIGLDLPVEPGKVAARDDVRVLWLGPDEWLVVGRDVGKALEKALAGQHVAVTDVSANRTCLELSGPLAADLLASGCPLDLAAVLPGPGTCAQTLFGRAQIILERPEKAVYRLYPRGSFAVYLARFLLAGMPGGSAG